MTASMIRQLPLLTTDGPRQMAADEALLATARKGQASLRFYQWSQPTVSLGYFQSASECLRDPLLAECPWLRRPTGGEALVHHHELTYALALPATPPWHPTGLPWPCRMHQIIAQALAQLGVTTNAATCATEVRRGPFLCFLHHTPGDLLCDGHKIAGSAQRRQRGGWLQHGGILLAQSPLTPELPGLRELTGKEIDASALAEAVAAVFADTMGWRLHPGDWTDEERATTTELAVSRYRDSAWNELR
jgi:lipoate-protein ligase A